MLVVTLFLASTFTLMGCGKTTSGLKLNPEVTAAVINNGGISVQKVTICILLTVQPLQVVLALATTTGATQSLEQFTAQN